MTTDVYHGVVTTDPRFNDDGVETTSAAMTIMDVSVPGRLTVLTSTTRQALPQTPSINSLMHTQTTAATDRCKWAKLVINDWHGGLGIARLLRLARTHTHTVWVSRLPLNYLRAVGRKVLWSSACVCLCALPARRFVSRSDTAVYISLFYLFLNRARFRDRPKLSMSFFLIAIPSGLFRASFVS